MLHLMGGALVMAAAFRLRAQLWMQRARRRTALREIAAALMMLGDAVHATLAPLPRLLRELSCGETARGFFEAVSKELARGASFDRAWSLCVQALPFDAREKAMLAAVGAAALGDEGAICAALTQAAARLSAAEEALASSERAQSRVTDALCLGSGAILCILLL